MCVKLTRILEKKAIPVHQVKGGCSFRFLAQLYSSSTDRKKSFSAFCYFFAASISDLVDCDYCVASNRGYYAPLTRSNKFETARVQFVRTHHGYLMNFFLEMLKSRYCFIFL